MARVISLFVAAIMVILVSLPILPSPTSVSSSPSFSPPSTPPSPSSSSPVGSSGFKNFPFSLSSAPTAKKSTAKKSFLIAGQRNDGDAVLTALEALYDDAASFEIYLDGTIFSQMEIERIRTEVQRHPAFGGGKKNIKVTVGGIDAAESIRRAFWILRQQDPNDRSRFVFVVSNNARDNIRLMKRTVLSLYDRKDKILLMLGKETSMSDREELEDFVLEQAVFTGETNLVIVQESDFIRRAVDKKSKPSAAVFFKKDSNSLFLDFFQEAAHAIFDEIQNLPMDLTRQIPRYCLDVLYNTWIEPRIVSPLCERLRAICGQIWKWLSETFISAGGAFGGLAGRFQEWLVQEWLV